MDFLNQLAVQVEAPEHKEPLTRHPCGTFSGYVDSVAIKNNDGQKIYEIFLTTREGRVSHSKWVNTDLEIQKAKHDSNTREMVLRNIAQHKQLMCNLGLWSREESKAKRWDEVQSAYEQIVGRKCLVAVKLKKDSTEWTRAYINPFKEGFQDVVDAIQPKPAPRNQAPAGYPQNNPAARQPGIDSFNDDIPF